MKCYACDNLLSNPELDGPTGRYYCTACMEPTTEEQFRLAGKDYIPIEVLEEGQTNEKPLEWTETSDDYQEND